MTTDAKNTLSFQPQYHELWERETGNFWAAIEDPSFPEVKAERDRIEAEGQRVSWAAQLQLNKFRMVAGIPYYVAILAIISEALRLAQHWSLAWQVVTGAVTLGLVIGIVLACDRRMQRKFPRT